MYRRYIKVFLLLLLLLLIIIIIIIINTKQTSSSSIRGMALCKTLSRSLSLDLKTTLTYRIHPLIPTEACWPVRHPFWCMQTQLSNMADTSAAQAAPFPGPSRDSKDLRLPLHLPLRNKLCNPWCRRCDDRGGLATSTPISWKRWYWTPSRWLAVLLALE